MSQAGSELDPSCQELAAREHEVDQLGELRQNAIGSHAASTFLITSLLQAFLHPTSCYKHTCKKFFSFLI